MARSRGPTFFGRALGCSRWIEPEKNGRRALQVNLKGVHKKEHPYSVTLRTGSVRHIVVTDERVPNRVPVLDAELQSPYFNDWPSDEREHASERRSLHLANGLL